MERNAQQILVILPHADNYVVAIQEMNKEIKNIKTYGLHRKGVENCTDADLEDFFNAPKLKDQQILVTLEGCVNGFEAEMVLFTEFHDFGSKYVMYRAKTKLQTTTLKKCAHPTLHEQYPVEEQEVKIPAPNLRASDFTNLPIKYYSKLQPKPDPGTTYVNYCNDFESLGSPEKLSQVSSIKQFIIVVPKTSTKKVNDFPLLLWLKLSNEWKTSICINLNGRPLPADHSMNFPIHWDNLEIVKISIPDLQGWRNWKNVLMAEIIHCHHCKLDVTRGFDFHRLFSVWSRIREEFKLHKYIFDKKQLDNESYDEFRMEILKEYLFVGNTFHLAKDILKSYGIDAQFQQPNRIDQFLKWLCLEVNSPLNDFLISCEIPEYPSENTAKINPERTDVTHLRHELIYLFDNVHPSSQELHRPLISLIWEEKLCRLFQEILINDFPHVVEESWFSEFVSMESVCQRKKETILKTRGNTSIYTQFQEKNVSTNDCIPPESRSIFAKIVMFIANQSI
ncbi:uncharacterized protein LOC131891886 isoform X1 [Tigriopus californicus]|nr:uncharacterized protein LOC131891886 isoform X1 [Tigriopus californicus]